MFRFIWKKKFSNKKAYEKVKRSVLCKDIAEGGLGMISIKDQQKMFNIKWLSKLLIRESNNATQLALVNYIFRRYGGLKYFVDSSSKLNKLEMKGNILSQFWQSVALNWDEIRIKTVKKDPVSVLEIL